MTTSYNGWPFIGAHRIVRALVPGTADVRIEIRAGEVATVLNAWAALWHKRIRPIDTYKPRDYWGWSATNDHPTSCHLSGTAIDLNASSLPFQRYTMPADQRDAVHELLTQFRGVLAWGGDWSNPPDEMHTEIAVPPGDPRLSQLARDLSAGYLGVYTPEEEPTVSDPVYKSKVPGSDYAAPLADFILEIDRKIEELHRSTIPAVLDRLTDIETKIDDQATSEEWKALLAEWQQAMEQWRADR
ncbi:M15 family metallopeptidase [Nocardia rhizosphaerae]|uniref:M15 family metallopeptidase n=1 Tax=Nocardia rhizosphaerae TaxID=1691571 RepID=A0ABV8LAL2_9NOCA